MRHRVLVPDGDTQADLAARRPPSYQIAVRGQDGLFHALQMPDNVTAYRWRADPQAAMEAERATFATQRAELAAKIDTLAPQAAQRQQFIDRAGQ
jgi:hypothetical protein